MRKEKSWGLKRGSDGTAWTYGGSADGVACKGRLRQQRWLETRLKQQPLARARLQRAAALVKGGCEVPPQREGRGTHSGVPGLEAPLGKRQDAVEAVLALGVPQRCAGGPHYSGAVGVGGRPGEEIRKTNRGGARVQGRGATRGALVLVGRGGTVGRATRVGRPGEPGP